MGEMSLIICSYPSLMDMLTYERKRQRHRIAAKQTLVGRLLTFLQDSRDLGGALVEKG